MKKTGARIEECARGPAPRRLWAIEYPDLAGMAREFQRLGHFITNDHPDYDSGDGDDDEAAAEEESTVA